MKNLKDLFYRFAQRMFGPEYGNRFVKHNMTFVVFLWVLGMACMVANAIAAAKVLFGVSAVVLLFFFTVFAVASYPHQPKNTREGV